MLRLLIYFAVLSAAPIPPLGNYPLVNQEGKPFQLHDLKGNYVMLSFIYTRCPLPKMCPLTTSLNKRLLAGWEKRKGAPPLKLLMVTLDPEHDNPKALRDYVKLRTLDEKHFVLATGNPTVLEKLESEFNIIGIPEEGGVSHNVKSILLDPELKPIKEFNDNEWVPSKVLTLIK